MKQPKKDIIKALNTFFDKYPEADLSCLNLQVNMIEIMVSSTLDPKSSSFHTSISHMEADIEALAKLTHKTVTAIYIDHVLTFYPSGNSTYTRMDCLKDLEKAVMSKYEKENENKLDKINNWGRIQDKEYRANE